MDAILSGKRESVLRVLNQTPLLFARGLRTAEIDGKGCRIIFSRVEGQLIAWYDGESFTFHWVQGKNLWE